MLALSQQPGGQDRLGDFLLKNFSTPGWTDFRACVAFVKESGVRHLQAPLSRFLRAGGRVTMSVGIDQQGSSAEGLRRLLEAGAGRAELWVFHNEAASTFHPKLYLFHNNQQATAYIGSGNLTEGGLFTNYEVGITLGLELGVATQKALFLQLIAAMNGWARDDGAGMVRALSSDLLNSLVAFGYVPPEGEKQPLGRADRSSHDGDLGKAQRLFKFAKVEGAPRAVMEPAAAALRVSSKTSGSTKTLPRTGFVMTLQQTDVGVGQKTKGASRRSPEIFIPLAARDLAPDFWGYPDLFVEDQARKGKRDREGVKLRIGGKLVEARMMTWPVKHDFRLRSEELRSAGDVGDLLRLELPRTGAKYDYYAEIIPPGTSQYERFSAIANLAAQRPSKKRYGYY